MKVKTLTNYNSETYTNRYGDKQTFTPDSEGNVIWNADFSYCRFSKNVDNGNIVMVDPSGGPYLQEDMDSEMVHSKIIGKKISHFIKIKSSYKIIFK